MYEASLFYRFRQLIGGFRMDAPPTVADGDPATARFSEDSELYVIVGAFAPGVSMRVQGIDADGVTPPTADPVQIGGVAGAVLAAVADNTVVHFVTDLYRRLRTLPEGATADGVADGGINPLKMGAIADAVLSALADGQTAHLVTDLFRRLWVTVYGQVLDTSLVDTVDHAASAGISYPSDGGMEMDGYKDLSFTGKFICGADNTVAFTVEGTNDEDATPANRDWIVLYAYRTDTNAVVNSISNAASTTTTFGWDFDNCNYKYMRIRLVIVNGGVLSNTIIVKARRKAL
jgi:hypothetical protein